MKSRCLKAVCSLHESPVYSIQTAGGCGWGAGPEGGGQVVRWQDWKILRLYGGMVARWKVAWQKGQKIVRLYGGMAGR